MIYNIHLDMDMADVLNEIDLEELPNILKNEDELKSFKYAFLKFKEAYCESLEEEDCFPTGEEEDQLYNFYADKCN